MLEKKLIMNLQLVYRYILSLTKNENLFSEKKRTEKKSVQRREVKRLLVFLFTHLGEKLSLK